MARISNDEILSLDKALRPGRSTYYQLLSLSQQLTSRYGAEHTGAYIREAADVYRDTGMLRMDDNWRLFRSQLALDSPMRWFATASQHQALRTHLDSGVFASRVVPGRCGRIGCGACYTCHA